MSTKIHEYAADLHWTGNAGSGTSRYDGYLRDYRIDIDGKPPLDGSADPAFRGDPAVHNPEDLFLSALAACHMLFYLALCAQKGVRVVAYQDHAQGWMETDADGGGRFRDILLQPRVDISQDSDSALADDLHRIAHERCFIANSCTVAIRVQAVIRIQAGAEEHRA